MSTVLRIHPKDNVAVALQPLRAGDVIGIGHSQLTLRSDIPLGHKIALSDLDEGQQVVKYGYPIGHTICAVKSGALIDHHTLATNLSGPLDYKNILRNENLPKCPSADSPTTFMGYLRPDGQAGIRNELWVIPTVGCVAGICQQIAQQVEGAIAFNHNYGCSQLGDDHEQTRRILRCMVHHPNAGGILVVGLGCENNQPEEFRRFCGDYDPERVRFMTCQQVEGDEVEEGVRLLMALREHAAEQQRRPLPISLLRIGLKCGGSDGLSGITANPLLGAFSDWLCQQGGATILTEVPEMFGAETLLMQRCVSDEVMKQTADLINRFKQYFLDHGQPVGENPSPGNKAGGISTLEEKALGCTQKSGSSPVCGVLEYGDRLSAPGLHLLCAPGNDLVASTALAAAGCQLVLFTTGRGTPFSTFVPTLKIASNTPLFRIKPHWMDFNAGTLLEGGKMDAMLVQFISLILATANGNPTRSEVAGIHDIAIWKNGITL